MRKRTASARTASARTGSARAGTGQRIAWCVALLLAAAPARAVCALRSAGDALEALSGRTAVPTNLVLFVEVVGSDDDVLTATSSDGDVVVFSPVEADGLFRLEPERALLPATEYTLCGGSPDVCVGFRTTDGGDDEVPPAPLASINDVHGLFRLESECGGFENTTVVVVEAEVSGDSAFLLLERAVGDDEPTLVRVEPLAVRENTAALVDFADEGGDATYTLTALDLAGNASEPTVLTQSLGCPGSCGHAGAPTFLVLLAALRARVGRAARRVAGVSAAPMRAGRASRSGA